MKEHNHPKPQPVCKHTGTLQYCDKCKVVYCTQCGEEFTSKNDVLAHIYEKEFNKPDNIQPLPWKQGGLVLCQHDIKA